MYKDGSHDRSKWHENISITSWWLAAVEAVNPASSMLGCGRGQTKNSNKCPNAFFPKMVSSFCLVLITLIYVQVFICLMSLALVSYLMLKKKGIQRMTDSRALLTKESGGCMGVNLILQLHRLITTAQTLAPNYVTGAGWQNFFCTIEEEEKWCPSLCMSVIYTKYPSNNWVVWNPILCYILRE